MKKMLTLGVVALSAITLVACGNDSSSGNSSSKSESSSSQSNVPTEYNNALAKAKIYSDSMDMSKAKIYDQLTSDAGDKFKADSAKYAVDHLKANYNENALKKAKTYQDQMHMSKDAIKNQLTSDMGEKFTEQQAQYAINHLK